LESGVKCLPFDGPVKFINFPLQIEPSLKGSAEEIKKKTDPGQADTLLSLVFNLV